MQLFVFLLVIFLCEPFNMCVAGWRLFVHLCGVFISGCPGEGFLAEIIKMQGDVILLYLLYF